MTVEHLIVGSGPKTVFCLHGWFGHAGGWGSLPDLLNTDDYRWVFTDNRGYGARQGEAGDYSLEEVSSDVRGLADDLGVDTFTVMGHSMGGAEVLRILADAPERVEKVIGITPVGATPTPFDEAGQELFSGAAKNRENRYNIVDFTTGNRLTKRWIDQVVDSSFENSTEEAVAGAFDAWSNADFLERILGNETPMLVLAGAHDPALGVETVRQTWTPHFPNVTVVELNNAGHYPMFETPIALATSIEGFLDA